MKRIRIHNYRISREPGRRTLPRLLFLTKSRDIPLSHHACQLHQSTIDPGRIRFFSVLFFLFPSYPLMTTPFIKPDLEVHIAAGPVRVFERGRAHSPPAGRRRNEAEENFSMSTDTRRRAGTALCWRGRRPDLCGNRRTALRWASRRSFSLFFSHAPSSSGGPPDNKPWPMAGLVDEAPRGPEMATTYFPYLSADTCPEGQVVPAGL